MPSLVKIGLVDSGEDYNVNSLQTDGQTDEWTDDGQKVIGKAHLSFQLR